MSWEPAQSSSRASNRWRPPSPAPAAPKIVAPTLKRESWRPTSSWTPTTRSDRPTKPEPPVAEFSHSLGGRVPLPERERTDRGPSSPPYRNRDSRPLPDDDNDYGRRGHGSKRDRRGAGGAGGNGSGGGPGAGAERSWEAWNNKVGAVSGKRVDEDRRAGPSRRDDYPTTFDRIRAKQDQAAGRSWSAWKSKVGTGADDRERERDRDDRQPEAGRDRDRGGREKDDDWKPRSKEDDDGWRREPERRGPEDTRSWAKYREKRETRSKLDERDDLDEGVPLARRRGDERKDKVSLPYSPGSRSPSPTPQKRALSPAQRRTDESPRRGTARRPSPDYGGAPPKTRRSPSPLPPRRRAPDRGSPDYALGADGRDRNRGQRPSDPPSRPRDTDPLASTSFRGRSPSPSTRRRRQDLPRALPRDVSPSASSSSSVLSRRDRSTDRRPADTARWRRDRSPEDRRPAGGPSPSEARHKRARRESPDYAPRAPLSPGVGAPSGPSKPPLPPQDSVFHGGRSGPPIHSRNQHINQHNEAEDGNRSWTRDRPTRGDEIIERGDQHPPHDDLRRFRRDSSDYNRTGPIPVRNDSQSDQRLHHNGRLSLSPNPNDTTLNRSWVHPHTPSVPFPSQSSSAQPPLAQPAPAGPWSGLHSRDHFVPAVASASQIGKSPVKGSSSPVKIDFGPASSPKNAGVPSKKAPGLRQFFDADSPGQLEIPSNSHSESHTPDTHPPSLRESEAELTIDTPLADANLQLPEVYLNKIAESEKQYTQHLDTIAPYIRSAFKEWVDQDQTQSLSAFLVHYFGRQPDTRELVQIEQLIKLRRQTTKDQAGFRDLHARATKDTKMNPSSGDIRSATSTTSAPLVGADQSRNGHSQAPLGADTSLETADTSLSAEDPNASRRRLRTDETYEKLACVGEGTYGKVYKARRVDDGVFVALKRIRMEVEKDGFPVTAMREIKLLQSLKHDNVIRLHEMMVSKGSVYMVFDYMEHDLTGVLSHPGISFSPANLKSLNHQMLSGLGYLHRIGILHRDMKGSNILLTAQGELKLADFGLARLYNRKRKADYTNRVITLWYRSPELLLGETAYGPEVDMWSAGCIMLEMYYTKPIIQGNDEIHQLEVIYGLMGTPREEDWPAVRDLPWYELVKPKTELRSKFHESFSKRLSPAAMELAEGLLAMNPAKRLSAKKALQTAYFVSEAPSMEKPTQLAGIGEHHEMSAKQERHRRKAEGGQ